jgi:hypothetical protein
MFNFGDVVQVNYKDSEKFLVVGKIPANGYFLSVGQYLCIDYGLWEPKEFFFEESLVKISEGEYEYSIIEPIFDPNFLLGDEVEFKELSIKGAIIAINPVIPPHNYTIEYLIMTENANFITVSINEAVEVKLIEKSN